MKPLIIAHRGDTQNAPEASLPAFVMAISKGADGVEFDLHFSKDGELIVHHDYQLGRMEDGSGLIRDYSLAELREFDIGSGFDAAFKGVKIPTFEEVLDLGKGKVRFEIELRCPTLAFRNKVLETIKRFKVEEDVEITSPHIPLLMQVRKANPRIRIGMFFYEYPEWKPARLGQQHILDWMTLMDAQAAHLPVSLLEADFIARLHEHKFLVHGSNLNEKETIQESISMGIDQFSTDRLEMAVEIRNESSSTS